MKLPKSVQQTIPIQRLWQDGTFQFGSKFSQTLRFSDINYAIASKADKTQMFLGYSELLNALDTGAATKITIHNRRMNRQDFARTTLLPMQEDHLDGYRQEYNQMLLDKVTGQTSSVVQERYITLSAHRKNYQEARSFFSRTIFSLLIQKQNAVRWWKHWAVRWCAFPLHPTTTSMPWIWRRAMAMGKIRWF